MAFSEEDVKGRELFASWAKRLGMTCHVDEAGNLIAHMDGQDNDLPAIMMGSHLDTVRTEWKIRWSDWLRWRIGSM